MPDMLVPSPIRRHLRRALLLAGLCGAAALPAHAGGVDVSIGIGLPLPHGGRIILGGPPVYAPPPVVVYERERRRPPPPVYVAGPPVYVGAPVVWRDGYGWGRWERRRWIEMPRYAPPPRYRHDHHDDRRWGDRDRHDHDRGRGRGHDRDDDRYGHRR